MVQSPRSIADEVDVIKTIEKEYAELNAKEASRYERMAKGEMSWIEAVLGHYTPTEARGLVIDDLRKRVHELAETLPRISDETERNFTLEAIERANERFKDVKLSFELFELNELLGKVDTRKKLHRRHLLRR